MNRQRRSKNKRDDNRPRPRDKDGRWMASNEPKPRANGVRRCNIRHSSCNVSLVGWFVCFAIAVRLLPLAFIFLSFVLRRCSFVCCCCFFFIQKRQSVGDTFLRRRLGSLPLFFSFSLFLFFLFVAFRFFLLRRVCFLLFLVDVFSFSFSQKLGAGVASGELPGDAQLGAAGVGVGVGVDGAKQVDRIRLPTRVEDFFFFKKRSFENNKMEWRSLFLQSGTVFFLSRVFLVTGFYLVSSGFTGSYRVLSVFTWFYRLLPGFYRVSSGLTGFYRVLPGFYRVSSGLTGFYRVLPGFYRVSSGFTRSYRVLPSFIGFYRVIPGFIGFYLVLPAFTGFLPSFIRFDWVLPGFNGFLPSFIRFY